MFTLVQSWWTLRSTGTLKRAHHAHKDARGAGHLVERSKGPSQVGGGELQDVEGIQAHHQAAEDSEQQSAQDEDLEGLGDLGG